MRKLAIATLLVVLPTLTLLSSWALAAAAKEDFKFTDVRQQTAASHQYEKTIKLTPAQQATYREALEGLPAPCCSDNTALTCCCPCNSARAWCKGTTATTSPAPTRWWFPRPCAATTRK